jgi:hypothetical protein
MCKEIQLTQNQLTIVDEWNYDLNENKWFAHKAKHQNTYYAWRNETVNGKQITIKMHSIIIERMDLVVPYGYVIDHVDRNGLNNLEENLRVITYSQSCINRRKQINCNNKYKGVIKKGKDKYQAYINYKGERKNLGVYYSEEYAAYIRDCHAKIYFGECAVLNFPNE